MKKASRYATNKAGIIKAERPVSDQPKATVVKGKDLLRFDVIGMSCGFVFDNHIGVKIHNHSDYQAQNNLPEKFHLS